MKKRPRCRTPGVFACHFTKIKLKYGTQQAEESKTIETPKPQLTKDEAIAYILRLKLFVDAMCTKIDD